MSLSMLPTVNTKTEFEMHRPTLVSHTLSTLPRNALPMFQLIQPLKTRLEDYRILIGTWKPSAIAEPLHDDKSTASL